MKTLTYLTGTENKIANIVVLVALLLIVTTLTALCVRIATNVNCISL